MSRAAASGRRDIERALAGLLGSAREARWLLEEVTADAPGEDVSGRLWELAERRRAGEPLQYLLGHWPFRGLELLVDRRALIPRPETEWLVDVALAELDGLLSMGAAPLALDMGTGTGAIALSLASERFAHGLAVVAVDADLDALALASENARRLPAAVGERVRFCAGSWWGALDPSLRGAVSLLVANPPYVAAQEWETLDPVVRDHEPRGALVGPPGSEGTPGFGAVELLVAGAPQWLSRPAAVVIEIAPAQREAALAAARSAGAAEAEVLDDLAGRPRALVARFR